MVDDPSVTSFTSPTNRRTKNTGNTRITNNLAVNIGATEHGDARGNDYTVTGTRVTRKGYSHGNRLFVTGQWQRVCQSK